MTRRFVDGLTFEGQDYVILDQDEPELFHWVAPQARIRPVMAACWRGYAAHYAVTDQQLELNGIDFAATGDDPETERLIEELPGRLPVSLRFTGCILLGAKRIGEPRGSKDGVTDFEDVIQLQVNGGKVSLVLRHADAVAELRRAIEDGESAAAELDDRALALAIARVREAVEPTHLLGFRSVRHDVEEAERALAWRREHFEEAAREERRFADRDARRSHERPSIDAASKETLRALGPVKDGTELRGTCARCGAEGKCAVWERTMVLCYPCWFAW